MRINYSSDLTMRSVSSSQPVLVLQGAIERSIASIRRGRRGKGRGESKRETRRRERGRGRDRWIDRAVGGGKRSGEATSYSASDIHSKYNK